MDVVRGREHKSRSSEHLMEGWLVKKDDRTQGWLLLPNAWRKRWFVLEGSVLRYYKTDQVMRKNPAAWTVSFDLAVDGFDYASLFAKDPEASKRKYATQLTIPVAAISTPEDKPEWKGGGVGAVRKLILGAESQSERNDWINLFKHIRVEARLRSQAQMHGGVRMLAESMAQDDFMAITGALQLERRRMEAASARGAADDASSTSTVFNDLSPSFFGDMVGLGRVGGAPKQPQPPAQSSRDRRLEVGDLDADAALSDDGESGGVVRGTINNSHGGGTQMGSGPGEQHHLMSRADRAQRESAASPLAPIVVRYKPDEVNRPSEVQEKRIAYHAAMTADTLLREYVRSTGGSSDDVESRFVTFRGNRLPPNGSLADLGVDAGAEVWVRRVRSEATKPRTLREHVVGDAYRRAHGAWKTLRERAKRAVAEKKRLDEAHVTLQSNIAIFAKLVEQREGQYHQVLHKLLGLEETEVDLKLQEAREDVNPEEIRSPLARAYAEAFHHSTKLETLATSNRVKAAKVAQLAGEYKKRAAHQLKLRNFRMKKLSGMINRRVDLESARAAAALAAAAAAAGLILTPTQNQDDAAAAAAAAVAATAAAEAEAEKLLAEGNDLDPPHLRLALEVRHAPEESMGFVNGVYVLSGVGSDGSPIYRNANGCAISRQPMLLPSKVTRYGAAFESLWTISSTESVLYYAPDADVSAGGVDSSSVPTTAEKSTAAQGESSSGDSGGSGTETPSKTDPKLDQATRCAEARLVPLGPSWRSVVDAVPSLKKLTTTIVAPTRVMPTVKQLSVEQAEGLEHSAVRLLRRGAMLMIRLDEGGAEVAEEEDPAASALKLRFVRLRSDLRTLEWRTQRSSPVAHCVRLDCVRDVTQLMVSPVAANELGTERGEDENGDGDEEAEKEKEKVRFTITLSANLDPSDDVDDDEEVDDGSSLMDFEDGAAAVVTTAAVAAESSDSVQDETPEALQRRARALLALVEAERAPVALHFECADEEQAMLWQSNLSLLSCTWQAASALAPPLPATKLATSSGCGGHLLGPDAWCHATMLNAHDWLAAPTLEERLDYALLPTAHTLATDLVLAAPFGGVASAAAAMGNGNAFGAGRARSELSAVNGASLRSTFALLRAAKDRIGELLVPGVNLPISMKDARMQNIHSVITRIEHELSGSSSSASASVSTAIPSPFAFESTTAVGGGHHQRRKTASARLEEGGGTGRRAWATRLDALKDSGEKSADSGLGRMRRSLSAQSSLSAMAGGDGRARGRPRSVGTRNASVSASGSSNGNGGNGSTGEQQRHTRRHSSSASKPIQIGAVVPARRDSVVDDSLSPLDDHRGRAETMVVRSEVAEIFGGIAEKKQAATTKVRTTDAANGTTKKQHAAMRLVKNQLVRDRKHPPVVGRLYRAVFVGKEAVDLLVKKKVASSRKRAVKLMKELFASGAFTHAHNEHGFEDKHLFYRCAEAATSSRRGSGNSLEEFVNQFSGGESHRNDARRASHALHAPSSQIQKDASSRDSGVGTTGERVSRASKSSPTTTTTNVGLDLDSSRSGGNKTTSRKIESMAMEKMARELATLTGDVDGALIKHLTRELNEEDEMMMDDSPRSARSASGNESGGSAPASPALSSSMMYTNSDDVFGMDTMEESEILAAMGGGSGSGGGGGGSERRHRRTPSLLAGEVAEASSLASSLSGRGGGGGRASPSPQQGGHQQHCTVCGESLKPGAKFCGSCGAKTSAGLAAAQQMKANAGGSGGGGGARSRSRSAARKSAGSLRHMVGADVMGGGGGSAAAPHRKKSASMGTAARLESMSSESMSSSSSFSLTAMMERAQSEVAATAGVRKPAMAEVLISKEDRRKRNNWVRDASDAMSGGDLVKALSCYRAAFAIDPRDARVSEQIAILTSGRGQSQLLEERGARVSEAENARDLAKMGKSSIVMKLSRLGKKR